MSGRADDLFAQIASFQNLHRAARVAARGKRYRGPVAQFLLRMESECLALADELQAGRWQPAGYHVFEIVDPKRRTICAAPFRDRVVHQAIVQVVEPRFERAFVADSYSCRQGKGTHRALDRVARWAREYPWALKLDVEKYFPSIDHEVAMRLLAKKIGCARTLALFAAILASWTSSEAVPRWFPGDALLEPLARRRGVPIGNLTSQFLSNVVLDHVDHAVKDGLSVRAYARYCDDMVVFGRGAGELHAVRHAIVRELARLRLRAHADKTQVFPVAQGVPWVGFRVYPDRVQLRTGMLARVRRRFVAFARQLERQPALGPAVRSSYAAWWGHGRRGLAPGLGAALAGTALRLNPPRAGVPCGSAAAAPAATGTAPVVAAQRAVAVDAEPEALLQPVPAPHPRPPGGGWS